MYVDHNLLSVETVCTLLADKRNDTLITVHLSFVHPRSHEPLVREGHMYRACSGDSFLIRNGKPIFISSDFATEMETERSGIINRIKTILRRYPSLYVNLITLVSPVCFIGLSAQQFVRQYQQDAAIISIGAGVHRYGPNIINIDVFPYTNVDVVANAMELPFASNCIDGVICEYLIEHVPEPERVINEIVRVLKPGGRAYIAAPFVYPFHACPNDFFRWSIEGAKVLCTRSGAIIDYIGPRSGPTSALVAQLGTWFAIACSFGNESLYSVLTMLFTAVFSPLKWIDIILGRYRTAIHGPGSWYAIIRKS